MKVIWPAPWLLLLLGACQAPAPPAGRDTEGQLLAARERLGADPTDEDAILWLGRRLGYVGRYSEAVEVFSRGLELHPDSAWLLRFRGHRYITLRRFDLAVADLERAEELARGGPDPIEPDGQPNAAGVPLTSLRSNIDYHLGLAHYLRGEFERALAVYERGAERARANPDRTVSHAYWWWLTLMQLGRRAEARKLLMGLDLDVRLLENDAYRDLLRLFRGQLDERSLLAGHGPGTVQRATRGYGAALARRFRGDHAGARALLHSLLASGPHASFGVIAAEVELARLDAQGR